jgi:hypothetical protein
VSNISAMLMTVKGEVSSISDILIIGKRQVSSISAILIQLTFNNNQYS